MKGDYGYATLKTENIDLTVDGVPVEAIDAEAFVENTNVKILAEIICRQATEKKLTIRDIQAALNIVCDKFYKDATI